MFYIIDRNEWRSRVVHKIRTFFIPNTANDLFHIGEEG